MNKEEKLQKTIQEISDAESKGSYDEVHQRLLKKRLNWFEENKNSWDTSKSYVHQAYEMVLLRYMNIDPEDVPIVYEDEKKIIWRSYNWCPVLEACRKLCVDTRKACGEGWEKSVQSMIEKINPKLKFSRVYNKLRPHGDYCEECVELVD